MKQPTIFKQGMRVRIIEDWDKLEYLNGLRPGGNFEAALRHSGGIGTIVELFGEWSYLVILNERSWAIDSTLLDRVDPIEGERI